MSSPNNSSAGLEGDIDTILEGIQPPTELLAALKPLPSCTVSDFLLVNAPSRPGSRKYFLEASSWFSLEIPNDIPENIDNLILPSEKLCEILDGYLRKAAQDGMNSVQHPVKIGVFLPLWVVRAWKWGNVLVKKQKAWRTCIDWVRETAVEEGWSQSLREKVMATVISIVWHSGYRGLQNGMVSATTLALLLSDEWLDNEQMDCIGNLIWADMAALGVASSTHMPSSYLVNSVTTNLRDVKSKVAVAGKDVEVEAAKSRSMKASVVMEINHPCHFCGTYFHGKAEYDWTGATGTLARSRGTC